MRTLLIALAIVAAAPHARGAVGDWKAYSKLVVTELAAGDREVWAATVGGITRANLITGSAQTYTPTEGLPDQRIYSAAYDPDRSMAWFGSEEGGLIRFLSTPGLDEPILQDPLLMGEVTAVTGLAIHDGMLYAGHATGVTVLDLNTQRVVETYHQVGPDFSYRNQRISSLSITGGRIYVSHERGISHASLEAELLLPGSWTVLTGDEFDGTTSVVTHSGGIFIGTGTGILKLDGTTTTRVGPAGKVNDMEVFDGAIWAATATGLYLSADGATWEIVVGLTDPVTALGHVEGSMLVAATAGGTYKLTSSSVTMADKVPGVDFPPSERFAAIAVDTSGALWVAPKSVSDGIFWLKNNTWEQIVPPQYGLPAPPDNNGYVSIAVDAENRVWAGGWGRGIAVIDQSGESPMVSTITASNSEIEGLMNAPSFVVTTALLADPAGGMWAGVLHSLAFHVPDNLTDPIQHALATELASGTVSPNYAVRALALDDEGVLWIGSNPNDLGTNYSPGLVLYYTGGTPDDFSDDRFVAVIGVEGIDSTPGLLSSGVNSIDVDPEGTVWVGTDNGVTSFKGHYTPSTNTYSLTSRHFTLNSGLPGNRVLAVVADSRNYKWLGTNGGLAQITPGGKVVTFSTANLVDPDASVVSLAMDDARGYLWIGTMSGLNRYEAYRPLSGDDSPTARPVRNPFELELSLQGTDYVLTGDPLTIQVSPGATLSIYTVTGELVWQTRDSGAGRVTWNGRTMTGNNLVASGVYLYDAELDGQHSIGKIAVVRVGR